MSGSASNSENKKDPKKKKDWTTRPEIVHQYNTRLQESRWGPQHWDRQIVINADQVSLNGTEAVSRDRLVSVNKSGIAATSVHNSSRGSQITNLARIPSASEKGVRTKIEVFSGVTPSSDGKDKPKLKFSPSQIREWLANKSPIRRLFSKVSKLEATANKTQVVTETTPLVNRTLRQDSSINSRSSPFIAGTNQLASESITTSDFPFIQTSPRVSALLSILSVDKEEEFDHNPIESVEEQTEDKGVGITPTIEANYKPKGIANAFWWTDYGKPFTVDNPTPSAITVNNTQRRELADNTSGLQQDIVWNSDDEISPVTNRQAFDNWLEDRIRTPGPSITSTPNRTYTPNTEEEQVIQKLLRTPRLLSTRTSTPKKESKIIEKILKTPRLTPSAPELNLVSGSILSGHKPVKKLYGSLEDFNKEQIEPSVQGSRVEDRNSQVGKVSSLIADKSQLLSVTNKDIDKGLNTRIRGDISQQVHSDDNLAAEADIVLISDDDSFYSIAGWESERSLDQQPEKAPEGLSQWEQIDSPWPGFTTRQVPKSASLPCINKEGAAETKPLESILKKSRTPVGERQTPSAQEKEPSQQINEDLNDVSGIREDVEADDSVFIPTTRPTAKSGESLNSFLRKHPDYKPPKSRSLSDIQQGGKQSTTPRSILRSDKSPERGRSNTILRNNTRSADEYLTFEVSKKGTRGRVRSVDSVRRDFKPEGVGVSFRIQEGKNKVTESRSTKIESDIYGNIVNPLRNNRFQRELVEFSLLPSLPVPAASAKVRSLSVDSKTHKLSPRKVSFVNPANVLQVRTRSQGTLGLEEQYLHEPDSDSDSLFDFYEEEEEEMNSRQPQPFRGLMSDDPISFMRHMEMWVNTQRGADDLIKINLTGCLLENAGLDWFQSLQIGTKDGDNRGKITKFSDFKELFLQKFKRDESDKFRLVQQIWETKQILGQSTEQYVNSMTTMARKVDLQPEQILLAIKSGLRADIKAAVMQHQDITTPSDIIKWGTIAEQYPPQVPGIASVLDSVHRIEENMRVPYMRPIVMAKEEEPVRLEQTSFQGGVQATPMSNGYRPPQTELRAPQTGYQAPQSGYGNQQNRYRPPQSAGGYSNNPGRRGGFNGFQRGYQQQNNRFNGPGNFQRQGQNGQGYGNPRGPARFNRNADRDWKGPVERGEACPCCGLAPVHDGTVCPARDIECRRCAMKGHFARVCQQPERQQGPQN
jgi:hypothetical protein